MSTDETNSIKDHMARLRLQMVKQKIANEKDRLMNRPGTEESTSNDLENQARLQQAMLRRQELLDKIRREQLLNEETKRPRSYSERRRYTPSPMPIPPSRRSLPDFARYNFYNTGADTNRSKPDVSQVKHVIEHKVKTPPPPRLPPITHPPPQIIPPAPGVIIQPPPPPQIMQQPAPAIIQSPPQHVIQQIPQPIVQNLTGQPQESRSMFNKADYMEMMMMQNAQMHQMVLQHMMLRTTSSLDNTVPRPVASGAVHHHHYTSPPASQPAVHHYTQMPQMEMRGGYPLRDTKPTEKTERKPQYGAQGPPRQMSPMVPPVMHPAPPQQPKKGNLNNRPSSMFLFGIILKEIVAALHRIYLNPSGNIYPVLNDIIGPNCYDLSALVHGGQLTEREESVLVQELQYVVENLIYHITEIMPSTGVLGTHRKSAVFELIRSGKRFPDGYFWRVEMDRIQFSEQGRTFNLGDAECFLLLTGIFISRSLITTLLMKPIDYGLSTQPLSDMAERNLRIVASTLLYLARRIAISRAQGVMPMPEEIARYLYDDNEMQHIYSRLSRTFNYCEGLLREWGTEYIRRLRASSMQQ